MAILRLIQKKVFVFLYEKPHLVIFRIQIGKEIIYMCVSNTDQSPQALWNLKLDVLAFTILQCLRPKFQHLNFYQMLSTKGISTTEKMLYCFWIILLIVTYFSVEFYTHLYKLALPQTFKYKKFGLNDKKRSPKKQFSSRKWITV